MSRPKRVLAGATVLLLAVTIALTFLPAESEAQASVDSTNLAKFVALMEYIRSQPTPAEVNADELSSFESVNTWLYDRYITGFITPFTGESSQQVEQRLQSVPAQDRFTAVIVESYRLADRPDLLDMIHGVLARYYVEAFTTSDLSGADEFLKRANIESRADAFDPTDYDIPAPSATATPGMTSPAQGSADSTNLAKFVALMEYIRSQPTPAEVNADELSSFESVNAWLYERYITGFITPFTGESSQQVEQRLQSVPAQDRFTAVIVESYRLADRPDLLDMIHGVLARYYVEAFTTSDLSSADEFLKRADIESRADAFDPTDYDIPAPSTSDTGSPKSDRDILALLYNATDGPNWRESANWLSDRPLHEWYGVSTNERGHVTHLDMFNNRLSGPLPSELANLSSLEFLALGDNRLNGPIPPELGNLSNLWAIDLPRSQLTGSIPPELGNLSNLGTLVLRGNQLSGPIPSELGNLSNLGSLYLDDNRLSGSIPPELGNLSNLETLRLFVNQLSGSIPPELGGLSNLRLLYLSDNRLEGCVPESLRALDIEENDLNLLGLPFCDGAPIETPRYSIETRDQEYGYTIDLPDGWVEEGEGLYERRKIGGVLRILSQTLSSETALGQYAESVRDNIRQDWWHSASLFEITSFKKGQIGNQEFYSLRYRVQESPMYCTLAVQERIYLADSLPGNPHGFRVRMRFCEELTSPGARLSMMRSLDSFGVTTQPASYYTQFIAVEGIIVKASDRVRTVSMYHVAEVIEVMTLSLREDIHECLVTAGAAMAISPLGEYITVLPEFAPQKGKPWENAAGLGAVKGQPVSGVTEASTLGGSPDVTVHEFAHAVQNLCFTRDEHEEWNRFYSEAQRANLFPGAYGMTNSLEFFAVFSESYFEEPHMIQYRWTHDDELTKQELSMYLPEIFAFLERIYPGFEVDPNATPTPAFRTSYDDRIVLTEHGYIVDLGPTRIDVGAAD